MKILYTLLLIVTLHIGAIAGEGISYKWMDGNKSIGSLVINETKGEESITYEYKSNLNVNFGEEVSITEEMSATLAKTADQEQKLLPVTQIKAVRSFNGRPRISVEENIQETKVVRTVNGKETATDRSSTVFCYMFLFVKPPVGVTSVYSELYGIDFKVVDKGNHQYLIKGAKNREHLFAYDEEGHLIKARIDLSSGVYTLIPS
ncbi:MAG: hypothetical protein KDD32_01985 [Bacteroidetes bacterium]|nr:hypothetical protein [Bacteroidota bacterium]